MIHVIFVFLGYWRRKLGPSNKNILKIHQRTRQKKTISAVPGRRSHLTMLGRCLNFKLEFKAKSVAESVAVKSESVFSEDSFDARDFHERQEANEANNSCV